MSSKNFIDRKVQELEAYKFAYIIRSLPEQERERYINELPKKALEYIAIMTFDKSESEIKLKAHESLRAVLNKCDDVDLTEIKQLLK